jgi:hypothetical protein
MKRQHLAEEMLDHIDLDVDFLKKIMFTDEATIHVSGKAHRHNVRIWGTGNPHVVREPICSTEHGKSSNIVWMLSVLPTEPTSRSTEVSKNLPEFRCNLPQTACG